MDLYKYHPDVLNQLPSAATAVYPQRVHNKLSVFNEFFRLCSSGSDKEKISTSRAVSMSALRCDINYAKFLNNEIQI